MASVGPRATLAELKERLRAGLTPSGAHDIGCRRWHVALQQVIIEDFRASAYGLSGKLIVGRMNGQYMGSRGACWGQQAKALGALAGECDLGLPGFSADGTACGLEVELKIAPDKPSPVQRAHHEKLKALGLRVAVVHDLKEFWACVEDYFGAGAIQGARIS